MFLYNPVRKEKKDSTFLTKRLLTVECCLGSAVYVSPPNDFQPQA